MSLRIGWAIVGMEIVGGGGGHEPPTYVDKEEEKGQSRRCFLVGRECNVPSKSESAVGSSR